MTYRIFARPILPLCHYLPLVVRGVFLFIGRVLAGSIQLQRWIMRSRKFLFVAVLALGALFLTTDQCYAGRLFPSLFGRRTPGVATPDRQTCEKPHPAVARIWIQTEDGTKRFGGTATLIDKLEGSGLVVGAYHCFDEMDETDEISLEFPNGEEFAGFLFAQDIVGDLALLTLDAPSADPMDIYLGTPKAGETSFIAGYGSGSDCYRTLQGSVRGYVQGNDGKMDSIHVTGMSRAGDSGGPITNAQGELIGVLSGTFDNRRKDGAYYATTVGAYNGRLCQLLNKEFSLPWKKPQGEVDDFGIDPRPDRDKRARGSGIEIVTISGVEEIEQPAPLPDKPMVDEEARQLLQGVMSRIAELDREANAAADREAERAAILAAGQAVIHDGLTDETIDAASTAAQPVLVRWLEGMGVAGFLAVLIVGILLVIIVRWLKTNTENVRSGKTKSMFGQAAATTAWKGDDAVARQIDRRLYGVGVLKETQAEAQAEPPSPPQPTVAELQAQIAALKEPATK